MSASNLTSLYKNHPVYFWLEDDDTRAYFSQLWPNEPFGYLVGGGEQNIQAIVQSARLDNIAHVFGIVDRDFYKSNVANWPSLPATQRIYRLPVHEFESFLLDADALAGCALNNQGRTPLDVDKQMQLIAGGLVWWMATKRVLSEVSHEVVDGFPPEPGRQKVQDLATAMNYISQSLWFASTAQNVPGLASMPGVQQRLTTHQTQYASDILSGQWKTEFSGKEVFRTLQSYVYQGGKGSSGRTDLVKAIARWQRANKRIPQDLESLRACVKRRVGI
jgi:hypothetical protein